MVQAFDYRETWDKMGGRVNKNHWGAASGSKMRLTYPTRFGGDDSRGTRNDDNNKISNTDGATTAAMRRTRGDLVLSLLEDYRIRAKIYMRAGRRHENALTKIGSLAVLLPLVVVIATKTHGSFGD